MQKINFKKLFLRNVFGICLLIWGSTAFITESSDEEYENLRVLITSSTGLQFSKEDSYEGRNIIYDCRLGLRDFGTIEINDNIHPGDMSSLIIKNCYNITLLFEPDHRRQDLQVKVNNVTSLTLSSRDSYSWPSQTMFEIFKLSISDVKLLYWDDFFRCLTASKLFLKLQNVVIYDLDRVFSNNYIQFSIINLHLKNVKITEIKARAMYFESESNLNLTVQDSNFENVHTEAFVFRGRVQIINSTFSLLDEAAFRVNSSSPFVFSGNHVKKMLNPFYIVASEVNIINNTFDSIENPWLSKIIGPDMNSFRTVDIEGNVINHWSHNLFYLEPTNLPDIIIFEGNYLNCSCKNSITVAYKFESYIKKIFMNAQQKNFCQNLGNCPLGKALGDRSGICSGTFRCPEGDQTENDENAQMWPSHIKSILSVLKNIDMKLDLIVSKNNSSVVDKPNSLQSSQG